MRKRRISRKGAKMPRKKERYQEVNKGAGRVARQLKEEKKPRPPISWLRVFFLLGIILLIMSFFATPQFNGAPVEHYMHNRALVGLIGLRDVINDYSAKYGELPPMTWGGGPEGKLYATLDLSQETYFFTTKIYDLKDPFSQKHHKFSKGESHDSLNRQFMYWNLKQYRQLLEEGKIVRSREKLPYTPDEEQLEVFERELGDYVIWSVGPLGWDGFNAEDRPIFLPYDPTNGFVSSAGSTWRSPNASSNHKATQYDALEPKHP
jgi:hypothetical protein